MAKTIRCNNADMWRYTTTKETFKNNNETCFSESIRDLYIVYSYGLHFPIYIYDYQAGKWFGNSNKYSSTTTRHQTNARPRQCEIEYVDKSMMIQIAAWRGIANVVARRIETAVNGQTAYQQQPYTHFEPS